MTDSMYHKQRRQYLYSQGICQVCGKRICEPGYVRCIVCHNTFNIRKKERDPDGTKQKQYLRELREYRRANGMCLDCGDKALLGRKRCSKCLEARRESQQVYRIKKRIRAQAIKDGIILGG